MIFQCCLVYPGNRRVTVSPITASCAEEAARIAARTMRTEVRVEIWHGADMVLSKNRSALQRAKCLELVDR